MSTLETRAVFTLYPQYAALKEPSILACCSELFSTWYGTWGPLGYSPGNSVKLSVKRLINDYLTDEYCGISLAVLDNICIGYAIYKRFNHPLGKMCWITQLVVNPTYRKLGCATQLIQQAANGCIGVCIVSSHPGAIKAVEKAMNNVYNTQAVELYGKSFIQHANIPYIKPESLDVNNYKINTQFYVDHTEINQIIANDECWGLGYLDDGEEYFVVVYR